MRIGIDYTPAISQTAGIGRIVRGLVGGLAAIDQSNEYVLFQARGRDRSDSNTPSKPNFTARPVGVSERTLTILWHRLGLPVPIDLFTGPVDIFHFPNYALAPLRRGSAVVTIHDLSFLVVPECADERLRLYLERVVPASVAAADFVITDSVHVRNDVICLLDVPPERVEVVYGGVEERFHRVDDPTVLEATRRKYSLHFPFIFFIGTIEPRKNLRRLIQAYERMRSYSSAPPHKLVIAGGLGWLYQDVFHEVDALQLADDVVFIGHVADEDLPALYSLSDALAWPSLHEGFGFPPLEAMACGTPVVTSSVSSLPEVVGDAALLVDPLDVEGISEALLRVLTDQQLRDDLRSRGIERARLFAWNVSAEKLLSVYQRIAGGSPRVVTA